MTHNLILQNKTYPMVKAEWKTKEIYEVFVYDHCIQISFTGEKISSVSFALVNLEGKVSIRIDVRDVQ